MSEPKLRESVERGVKWLLSKQKEDGSFDSMQGGLYQGAMTGLAVLALHDAGHSASDKSDEGRAIVKAVNYLCSWEPYEVPTLPGRYLGREDRSRMYGHGIMTFALASVVDEVPDVKLRISARTRVMSAVDLILASQQLKKKPEHVGGWRYEPQSSDSDVSVTVWQLLALRAAVEHASVKVPESAWTLTADFVKRLSLGARKKPESIGGISYEGGDRVTFSTTAMGVVALQCCGQGDAPEAKAARAFLDRSETTPRRQPVNDLKKQWFYTGMKHCSQAMIVAEQSDHKKRFLARLTDVLVPAQNEDGSWQPEYGNEKAVGAVFATALAVSAMGPWMEKE